METSSESSTALKILSEHTRHSDSLPAFRGPSFIRFQSNEAIDPTTGYPLQAFSAKFT